jgi:hypothetical protein
VTYSCRKCDATGTKLWREYAAYSSPPILLCVVCACAINGISPRSIDARGLHTGIDGQPSDSIGWYVPAVADDEGNWWGYTSVPEDAYERWAALPTRVEGL